MRISLHCLNELCAVSISSKDFLSKLGLCRLLLLDARPLLSPFLKGALNCSVVPNVSWVDHGLKVVLVDVIPPRVDFADERNCCQRRFASDLGHIDLAAAPSLTEEVEQPILVVFLSPGVDLVGKPRRLW